MPHMPFLVSHFFMQVYKDYNTDAIFHEGMWTTFMSEEERNKRMEEGLELLSNNEKFEEYKKEIEVKMKEVPVFCEEILKEINKENVERAFKLAEELFRDYSKTEYFFTDKAFQESKNNKELSKNLEEMGDLKNRGRAVINDLFLVEDSWFSKLLSELSEKFNLDPEIISQLSMEEFYGLFDNKMPNKEAISERNRYAMITENKRVRLLQGEDADQIIQSYKIDVNQEIKGQSANKGKVKGKVKLFVYGFDEFDKVSKLIDEMEEGDILVAETTSPEIFKACKKASAIITSEGGLLSHAAIVSRELKIPCIVGTGNATQVLKDGDEVEVDADKGTVRILEKN